MTDTDPVEELIWWRRFNAFPGSIAWGQCRAHSWALSWPGSGPYPVITPYRPTARRLSRHGPCTCTGTVPRVPDVAADLGRPAPPRRLSLQAAAHRWRHWRWWRTHGRVRRIRRGDIALAGPPSPLPSWAADDAAYILNLNLELGYVTLIELAARDTGGFWVRRFRLRRRRVRVILIPPGRLARLFLAHKRRGDLTWAPRPRPAPVNSRAPVVLKPLTYHFAGSWLLRGGAGPMPRGYPPLPPPRR